jgi:hypothetical protein
MLCTAIACTADQPAHLGAGTASDVQYCSWQPISMHNAVLITYAHAVARHVVRGCIFTQPPARKLAISNNVLLLSRIRLLL